MNKYVTEFVGTFFLVLVVGLTALARNPFTTGPGLGTPLAPLAIGAVLMVMVYMGGHVSGAHYNPAVSLAALLVGRLPLRDFVIYVVAQMLGAILASLLVPAIMLGNTFVVEPSGRHDLLAVLLVEALFTFALALVVLNSAYAKGTSGNSFYGLAIGFTVLAGAIAGGPISGGAFNPAVGTGPIVIEAALSTVGAVAEDKDLSHFWMYLVGPLAGGAFAALIFWMQNPEDFTPEHRF